MKDDKALEAFLTEYNISKSLHFRVTAKQGDSVVKAFEKVVEVVDKAFSTVEPLDESLNSRDTARLGFSMDAHHTRPYQQRKQCC